MIIIAVEGLDKSGKRTQVELLHEALYARGFNVESSEFHRYDTPTGQLIRQFLDGTYVVEQKAIECIMAADKYAQLDWFNEIEQKTDVLILDRYTLSQRVYAEANKVESGFVYNLLEHLPEPDFQFYLDIDPVESMKRKGQHGDNDKYESNHELLVRARESYQWFIEYLEEDGLALTVNASRNAEEIHKSILSRTLTLLTTPEEDLINE